MSKLKVEIQKVENGFILHVISGRFYSESFTHEVYQTFDELLDRIKYIFEGGGAE